MFFNSNFFLKKSQVLRHSNMSTLFFFAAVTMSKRAANIVDGTLPSPPSPTEFITLLQTWKNKVDGKKRAGSSSDPVHGNVFSADELDGKKGTAGAESSGVACALEFHKLLIQLNASYLSLDEWFVSWKRFVVDPKELCATEVEIQDAIELRNQQCSLGIKQYIMPVSSFRTYVNGVCRVVTKQGTSLVSTSAKQLPNFQAFMSHTIGRWRLQKAQNEVNRTNSAVLSEAEFQKLMCLKALTPLDQQRQNILCLVWCSGLRGDSLSRLQMNSFKEEVTADGQKTMKIVIANMKNLPASIALCDAKLYQQTIMEAPDALFCPLAAVRKQQELVRTASYGDPTDDSPLFRSVNFNSEMLKGTGTSREMYRGIAKWVSRKLNRSITFKDCGRRAAMSRLANDSSLSISEIAKFFAVHPNTIGVYQRNDTDSALLAASILSGARRVKGEPETDRHVKDESHSSRYTRFETIAMKFHLNSVQG